jgi:hypothetical protein
VTNSVAHPRDARRPLSAWLLLVLAAATAVAFSLGVVRLGWLLATNQMQVLDPVRASLACAWRIALVAGSAATVVGVYRHTSWSRWTGLLVIFSFATWSALRTDGPYPNEAQEGGAWFGRVVVMPLLCVWWAYAFAFSRKARAYFAHGAASAA